MGVKQGKGTKLNLPRLKHAGADICGFFALD
jgi:hypothetical protein